MPVSKEQEDRESLQNPLSTRVGLPDPPLPDLCTGRSPREVPQSTDPGHPPGPGRGLTTLDLALDAKVFTAWSLGVSTGRHVGQQDHARIRQSRPLALPRPPLPAPPRPSSGALNIPRHTVHQPSLRIHNGTESDSQHVREPHKKPHVST